MNFLCINVGCGAAPLHCWGQPAVEAAVLVMFAAVAVVSVVGLVVGN